MKAKMFFLVVAMLLCRGVAYAYSPSANDPISKSGGIEQDIPPPIFHRLRCRVRYFFMSVKLPKLHIP